MGDAVEGSNPSSDGVVALSNYIESLESKMFGVVWPTVKGIGELIDEILPSYGGRVVKAGV